MSLLLISFLVDPLLLHAVITFTCLSVQLWVDRITQTWVHCSKFTGRSIRARNLEDSFVHSQQHLLQENAALRQSLEDLTKHQAEKQSHFDSTDRYAAQLFGADCVLGTALHLSAQLDLTFSGKWCTW